MKLTAEQYAAIKACVIEIFEDTYKPCDPKEGTPKEDPEAWRAEYLAKQAAGVKFECDVGAEGSPEWIKDTNRSFEFLNPKYCYREVQEAPKGLDVVKWAEGLIQQLPDTHEGRNSWLLNHGVRKEAQRIQAKWKSEHADAGVAANPTIHHLAERKLWLAQREAGTNERWQEVNKFGVIFDIPVDEEPSWYPETIFRVKPKTVKYYFALAKGPSDPFAISFASYEKLICHAKRYSYTIIGDIEEREVPILDINLKGVD